MLLAEVRCHVCLQPSDVLLHPFWAHPSVSFLQVVVQVQSYSSPISIRDFRDLPIFVVSA
jgi:hypothetical protein